MKDGRTHLAHKAEHTVDLDSGALVAVTLHGADVGDTTPSFVLCRCSARRGVAILALWAKTHVALTDHDMPRGQVSCPKGRMSTRSCCWE